MPQLLDTVNTYLGMWSKLAGANAWYAVPVAEERARLASQNWHRDPEDRTLVKVFLHLSDVTAGCGPLEYIPGSREGGPYAHLWPATTGGGGYGYPPQDLIETTVPAAERVTCTGPRGTLVFCDTSGLHRGGYCTAGPRVTAFWVYLTPASLYPRLFALAGDAAAYSERPEARFALTCS
jgi:hypothetical protein